jgi:hypothetical protein
MNMVRINKKYEMLNKLIQACLTDKHPSSSSFEIIKGMIPANFRAFLKSSCFYYSAGANPSPIVGCLDLTQYFIYCDIHDCRKNKSELLYRSKSRLQEHHFTELYYCSLYQEWFKLYEEKYFGGHRWRYCYPIDEFKSEISIWKTNESYFVLIYIIFDNNAIWHHIILENKTAPKIICYYQYEGGVDYNKAQFEKDMLPEYWLGYTPCVGKFELASTIPCFGEPIDRNEKLNFYRNRGT